jgi:hypothetical protein
MYRKLITAAVAVVLPLGLVAVSGGVASAHPGPTHGPPAPVVATGTTTCNFHGSLRIGDSGTFGVRGNMVPGKHVPVCTNKGGSKLRTGHLSNLRSTDTITGLCSLLTAGPVPDVSGGTIKWAPRHHVASSTGVALTGGSASTVTIGSDTYLQITYTDGSVAGGSFMNASGAGLTVRSRATVTELTADCASGPLNAIAVVGSITL